jgi:hypothetical protein
MNPPTKPNPEESARIPDVLPEQEEAELLRDRERLFAAARDYIAKSKADPNEFDFAEMAEGQLNAASMANEIREYLEVVTGNLEGHGSERGAAHARRLAGYARQLEALALSEVEYLIA